MLPSNTADQGLNPGPAAHLRNGRVGSVRIPSCNSQPNVNLTTKDTEMLMGQLHIQGCLCFLMDMFDPEANVSATALVDPYRKE